MTMDASRQSNTSKQSATSSITDLSESGTDVWYGNSAALEALGDKFQKEMTKQHLLRDETSQRKTVHKVFSGSDAVTVIQSLLPVSSSREEAMERGNALIQHFGFFGHVANPHSIKELEDSPTEYYKFQNNLPSQVQRALSNPEYSSDWGIVRALEKHIECKDRKYVFKKYPDCFVAQEAVDVMLELKLVKTRREAVALMRLLNDTVRCCQHVVKEHEFKDEYLFFRFCPQAERIPDPAQTTSITVGKDLLLGGVSSRGSSREGGRLVPPMIETPIVPRTLLRTSSSTDLTQKLRQSRSYSPTKAQVRKPDPDGVKAGEVY